MISKKPKCKVFVRDKSQKTCYDKYGTKVTKMMSIHFGEKLMRTADRKILTTVYNITDNWLGSLAESVPCFKNTIAYQAEYKGIRDYRSGKKHPVRQFLVPFLRGNEGVRMT